MTVHGVTYDQLTKQYFRIHPNFLSSRCLRDRLYYYCSLAVDNDMYPCYPRPEIAMIVVARSARSFVHLLIVITIYVRQSSTQTTLGMPAISSAPPGLGWGWCGVGGERHTVPGVA